MTITLGSLFDGIGVFPLAASRHGITPIWASEIVPDAISITKRHFLDGGKIPAVHVITFGSPCQNLSSIVLLCAEYIMEGIAEVLQK